MKTKTRTLQKLDLEDVGNGRRFYLAVLLDDGGAEFGFKVGESANLTSAKLRAMADQLDLLPDPVI